MTEFLHNKYIEFMRTRYGVQSGIVFGNREELMCDFATEMAKEYIKQAQDFEEKNKKLKILISSLVYEINQIWDISEMNEDLRMCAEKIDREVTLSKMAEDNRLVISALGFAVVPPKPKVDVKEI